MVTQRKYFGESEAADVIEWLNNPQRPKDDAVEALIKASREFAAGVNGFAAQKKIRAVLDKSGLKLRPYWSPVLIVRGIRRSRAWRTPAGRSQRLPKRILDRSRWNVDWDPEARRMPRAQSLALYRSLELGRRGLLGNVRECARKGCGQWFYARFGHHSYHSTECQQATFRSDPDYKRQRAARMRELRHERRLRRGEEE